MNTAVPEAKSRPPQREKKKLNAATERASFSRPRPSSRAISVPPPVPAMVETAMQTLKIGRISADPATIMGLLTRPMKKVSAML